PDYPNIDYGVDLFSLNGTGSWTFFTNVLTTVMGLFPGQYIHCGGDEVVASEDTQWESYTPDSTKMTALGVSGNIPGYQYWFSTNLATFIHANGRTMMGWTEIENYSVVPNAVCMDWENGSSSKAVA